MKFTIKNEAGENIVNLMRRIGYHFDGTDEEKSKLSFVHPIGSNLYPRFHIYLKENKETREIEIDLHLDQKRPIYKGVRAHSAEYEGETVKKESERIRKFPA